MKAIVTTKGAPASIDMCDGSHGKSINSKCNKTISMTGQFSIEWVISENRYEFLSLLFHFILGDVFSLYCLIIRFKCTQSRFMRSCPRFFVAVFLFLFLSYLLHISRDKKTINVSSNIRNSFWVLHLIWKSKHFPNV